MPYYKNVINDEIVGFTESPVSLNCENFFEISEEEYIEIGGVISQKPEPEKPVEDPDSGFVDMLKDALLE